MGSQFAGVNPKVGFSAAHGNWGLGEGKEGGYPEEQRGFRGMKRGLRDKWRTYGGGDNDDIHPVTYREHMYSVGRLIGSLRETLGEGGYSFVNERAKTNLELVCQALHS